MTSESVSRFRAAALALAAQTLEAGLAYLFGQYPKYRAVKVASGVRDIVKLSSDVEVKRVK